MLRESSNQSKYRERERKEDYRERERKEDYRERERKDEERGERGERGDRREVGEMSSVGECQNLMEVVMVSVKVGMGLTMKQTLGVVSKDYQLLIQLVTKGRHKDNKDHKDYYHMVNKWLDTFRGQAPYLVSLFLHNYQQKHKGLEESELYVNEQNNDVNGNELMNLLDVLKWCLQSGKRTVVEKGSQVMGEIVEEVGR